jgi:pyrimidine-nucleoside phosphorylase
MRAVDILRKKRDGLPLEPEEIEAFVHGATHQTWPEYQLGALLMAIVIRGMTPQETAHLTHAMVHSGVKLDLSDLPGPKVDKHSTGGVGDKTSLILAPLASACGVVVPMMSGRSLGHSGGTLDKLEAIPHFRVALWLDEFRVALRQVGCALIGQTAEIAPADRVLYALRDVTATVESIPLITASILSKKVAEGISGLVMDVKCGKGAFMKKRDDARALAQSLVSVGQAQGLRMEALITEMNVPLGRTVGNSLEVEEAIAVLRGQGSEELTKLSVHLAARMVRLAGVASTLSAAERKVRDALTSGRGLEKFRQIIAQQHGDPSVVDDPSRLPHAPKQHLVRAPRSGYITTLDAELIGRAAMHLGAGRDRVDDVIDPSVGVVLASAWAQEVRAGDAVFEVHYHDEAKLAQALPLLDESCRIGDEAPTIRPLILETLE